MKTTVSIPHVHRALSLFLVPFLQLGMDAAGGALPAPQSEAPPAPNTETIIRDLAARSASWIAPPAALETLEYDFVSGSARSKNANSMPVLEPCVLRP